MKTPSYSLFVFWSGLNVLLINHYIGTVPSQMSWIVRPAFINESEEEKNLQGFQELEERIELLTTIFNWIVSLAFIVAPIVGRIIDKTTPPVFCSITTGLGILTSCLKLVKVASYLQILTFVAFALWRMFFYATACTFLIVTYGVEKFGRLWGCCLIFTALFALLQYPMTHMAIVRFSGSYLELNLLCLGIIFISSLFPFYIYKDRNRSRLLEEVHNNNNENQKPNEETKIHEIEIKT
jgi:hypothetical protein